MRSSLRERPRPKRSLRSDSAATRARIVATAERLFAERGIDAVSLTEINQAAGQRNKSALQYHFGSKMGLIQAILDKHQPGIERSRHEMLDEVEASGRIDLRGVTLALVSPVADKLEDPDGGIAYIRVNAQLIGHPRYPLLDLATRRVNRGADRLIRMVALASPELPDALRIPRWLLLSGLLFHAMADYSRLVDRRQARLALPSQELFVSNLVDSLVALYEAPISAPTRRLLR